MRPRPALALHASFGHSGRRSCWLSGRRHWCRASIASAGTISTPMLRVAAASAPHSPASHHRPRRAPQNEASVASRNGDSLYDARKKNVVGNTAKYTTALRAADSDISPAVRKYRTMREPAKQAFDTTSEAAKGCPPNIHDTAL